MKSLIIIASMFFTCLLDAKSQGSPPQRFVPPVNSLPQFLDSVQFKKDFSELKVLKKIYVKLKREGIGMAYSYGFLIDKNGKAELKWPETNPRLIKINPFIETMLKTYHWIPSHKLTCKKCLVSRNADLTIIFMTEKNYISYKIDISEEGGIGKKLNYGRILMN